MNSVYNVPDHHIKLINPLAQRAVGEDSSVPHDDARLTAHTATHKVDTVIKLLLHS